MSTWAHLEAASPMPEERPPSSASRPWGRLLALGLGLSLLLLAGVHTHPLWRHLGQGIPYGYHVVPGFELVPLMPGDHLQFLYWCWLLSDNLAGNSPLFSNPYEFNTFLSAGLPGFANFPLSLLFVLFLPLGLAGAYNALVFLSYLLAGLAAYALARQVLNDRLAALPAALVFALLPFRAAQTLSGHLYGFAAFLLPLTLWCLERGLARRSWAWGAGAGLCLVAMARMEGHLIYYTALMLGLYVPLRLLLGGRDPEPAADPPPPEPESGPAAGAGQALPPVLAGLCLGLTAHLAQVRLGRAAAFWSAGLAETLGVYLLVNLGAWLLLAGLAASLAGLGRGQARRLAGRGFWPLLLSPLYAVQFFLDVPHLGTLLTGLLALAGLALLLPPLWRARRRPRVAPGWWRPVLPLALGLLAGAGFMIHVKRSIFAASIAGQGRGLDEVRLFSPRLGDLFDPANVHMERLIYFGWALGGLALLGLLMLVLNRPRRADQAGLASLWAGLGLLFTLLCLGPSLPALPLYQALYKFMPYFNFPRVPGRLIIFAVLMWALLAGWALRELSAAWRRGAAWRRPALGVGVGAAVLLSIWPPTPAGVCLLPPAGPVEEAIRREMPQGPRGQARLLGLPIWPGDSHQSSIYELTMARTGAAMVNGYSPVVARAYVEQVFSPLYPLDLGLVDAPALQTLERLQVPLVAFHDDDLVYPRKISPFPPALARNRLLASGAFTLETQAGNVFLLRRQAQAAPDPSPGRVVSPVVSLWEAEDLKRGTGRLADDPQASGWGLLFAEAPALGAPLGPRLPRAGGNLAQARAGRDRPGFLSFGPFKAFPPGDYRVAFRLRRGPGPIPGHVEVASDSGQTILARAELSPERLPADGAWHDVELPLTLEALTILELRCFFAGQSDLDLDLVLVGFAGGQPADGFYRAADLWRQTGDLLADQRVPGGWAVLARAGYHPPLYVMHGPQVSREPGRYRARFSLAAQGAHDPQARLADLVVATDLGRLPLGRRALLGSDLGPEYRDVSVDFSLQRRCELDLRVRLTGGGSFCLAGVSLERLE